MKEGYALTTAPTTRTIPKYNSALFESEKNYFETSRIKCLKIVYWLPPEDFKFHEFTWKHKQANLSSSLSCAVMQGENKAHLVQFGVSSEHTNSSPFLFTPKCYLEAFHVRIGGFPGGCGGVGWGWKWLSFIAWWTGEEKPFKPFRRKGRQSLSFPSDNSSGKRPLDLTL